MEEILSMMDKAQLLIFIGVAVAAYYIGKFIKTPKTNGWNFILVASLIFVVRQIIENLPDFKTDLMLQATRYLVGWGSSLIFIIGFLIILIDYLKLKAQMEA